MIFTMDGSWHYAGGGKCGCHGDSCPCGGTIHTQPCYGGIFWECDRCGSDAYPGNPRERIPHEPPAEIQPPACWKCGAVEQFHHCAVSALERR